MSCYRPLPVATSVCIWIRSSASKKLFLTFYVMKFQIQVLKAQIQVPQIQILVQMLPNQAPLLKVLQIKVRDRVEKSELSALQTVTAVEPTFASTAGLCSSSVHDSSVKHAFNKGPRALPALIAVATFHVPAYFSGSGHVCKVSVH